MPIYKTDFYELCLGKVSTMGLLSDFVLDITQSLTIFELHFFEIHVSAQEPVQSAHQ